MGITGLIPFLEKASSKVHLKDLRGTTVAIDSYCWLHKGVYSCADKLARGEDSDQYINYCLKYVQMLLSYNIKPIMVLDGMALPAKALTEKRRRESRKESKKRAAELLRLGKIEQARSHMRRCVDVTHEMALRLIQECRLRNVDCIVAPYEADAQMAWLNKTGIAQYVITEDSDLTLFGARNIIFKLDLSGTGLLVEAEKLHLAMGCNKERYNFDKFRRMCILSGCDYLDSLSGIGLMKSCKFMLKTEQENMSIALKKIPQYLNMKQLQVDDEYIENFLKAEATFRHMYVYNPLERRMERLNALEDFQTDEKYCCNAGTLLEDNEQALNLALGNLNPFTFKKLDTWLPESALTVAPPKHIKRAKHKSIWQPEFQNGSPNKTKVKPTNCALYFKKVDFISKIIHQDISENQSIENEKPAEAEVFALYKHETKEQCSAIKTKRKRRYTDDEDNDSSSDHSTSTSIQTSHHNPFAKTQSHGVVNDQNTKLSICANGSLLKVLSPKKFKNETMQSSSFRRNNLLVEEERIEIRSRFFKENKKLVQESLKAESCDVESYVKNTPDVSEEIETLERLSQQHAESQALLYHSPSPQKIAKKQCKELVVEAIPLSHSDSGIESISTTESDEVVENPLESIEISDEDNTISVAKSNQNKRDKCGQRSGAPRLGLSKSKVNKTKKMKVAKNSSISPSNSNQTQTRLSMYGFKKKSLH